MKAPSVTGAVLLVALAATVPYLNSLAIGFRYDDAHALVRNPHLRRLQAVPSYFVDSGTFSSEPGMAMYRPMLQTTFALNYALSEYEAWSWHAVNVGLHAAAAVAVLLLGRGLLSAGPGLVAGLVFALHPVHTEAVDYLSSRSEVLSMGLVLWALVCMRRRRTWSASALYAAALLSKSAAVVFLPLGLTLEWVQPAPGPGPRWRVWLPAAGVTAAYLGVITLDGFLPRSLAQHVRPYTQHLWTQAKAVAYYLRLAAFPQGLSVEHGIGLARGPWESPVWTAVLLALSVTGLSLAAVVRRRGWVAVTGLGGLWFLAGLGLTFLVPLNVILSEHRLYLPIAGLALAALGPLAHRSAARDLASPARIVLAGLVLTLYGVVSWQQNQLWRNPLDLWSRAVSQAPESYRAWSNYGLALQSAGRKGPAAAAYERAIALHPGHGRAWNNLGLLREEAGQRAAAEAAYRRAAAASPTFSGPLANLGRLYLASGRLDSAAAALEAALRRNPLDIEALVHAGRLAQVRGDTAAARRRTEAALTLDEHSAAAANNMGLLRWATGDTVGARMWLRRALAIEPRNAEAAINLALLEAQARGEARESVYRRLVATYPDRVEPVLALGRLWRRRGRLKAEIRLYRQALDRGLRDLGLRLELGAALQRTGEAAAALRQFRLAARQAPQNPAALAGRAAAAAATGHLQEALGATRDLLAVDPGNAAARANRERLEAAVVARGKGSRGGPGDGQ